MVAFSDIVLKNKGACLTTVQYDTRNSISNPQEDESYLICTIKNKIFKFLNYLIIMHCDMIIFSVLCIIAIFLWTLIKKFYTEQNEWIVNGNSVLKIIKTEFIQASSSTSIH